LFYSFGLFLIFNVYSVIFFFFFVLIVIHVFRVLGPFSATATSGPVPAGDGQCSFGPVTTSPAFVAAVSDQIWGNGDVFYFVFFFFFFFCLVSKRKKNVFR
jgi:hypothetical protein